MSTNKFLPGNGVAAHRGNMSEFAENTIPSFQSAINLGSDWLELDIRRTKDGHLLVTHDESAYRTTGVDIKIGEANLEELQALNFGHYLDPSAFVTAPLLVDLLRLIQGKNVRITIQPKENGLVKDAIKLAEKYGVKRQIAFNDINCEYLIESKISDINIPVFWDRLENTDLNTDIYIAKHFCFETLMYLKEALTLEKAKRISAEGFTLGACVVNEIADMKLLKSWGVQIFYTDYPKKLIELI